MNFKLDIDDLLEDSVDKVKERIDSSYKCPLKELKLFDLLLNEKGDAAMRHGIYMFFDEANQCVYVGKCSSSHFAHRLGAHFGMSPKYDMNTFLRRAVEKYRPENKNSYQSYVETLKEIGSYSYLMINANGKTEDFIKELEKLFLRVYRRPSFNKRLPPKLTEQEHQKLLGTTLKSLLPSK